MTELTQEQKRENRSRYCAKPDVECHHICVGFELTLDEDAFYESTKCEHNIQHEWNYLGMSYKSKWIKRVHKHDCQEKVKFE